MTKRGWRIAEACFYIIMLIAIFVSCTVDQIRIHKEMNRAETLCQQHGGEWLYTGRGYSCIGDK